MVVKKIMNQTRYIQKVDNNGDYFVITANGDLAWGDQDEGIWATSKKIK